MFAFTRSAAALAALVASLQPFAAYAAPQSLSSSACSQLLYKYGNQTFAPGTNGYNESYIENWSMTCVQMPFCVFEPNSAEDVAGAIRILTQTNTSFAIRGGGHMQVPGASSITNGVLISAERLTQKEFINYDQTLASLGPGNRWVDVYEFLKPYKRAIVGGRYQPVGVPGLILGGGISYFGSQQGWAANSVVNFQVVLANSTIVNANATSNPDLFWALKGGMNNFGIVTRFDVKTYPLPGIYGGTTVYDVKYLDKFLDAVGGYSAPNGGSADALTSVNPSVEWNFTTGAPQLVTITTRNSTVNNTAAFANFTSIPNISTDFKLRPDMVSLTEDTALTGLRNQRALYFAKGIKATPEAISIANKTFFEAIEARPKLRAARGMLVAGTYQTISKSWLEVAVASGGDALDLDPAKGGFISFLGAMIWDDADDDYIAYEYAYNVTDTIAQRVQEAGLDYPFDYVNDATLNEAVFQFYGDGNSLPRMNSIARSYDPTRVFQRLVPGGFKLSSTNQTRPVDLDKRFT